MSALEVTYKVVDGKWINDVHVTNFCCKEMQEAWEEDVIGLGDPDWPNSSKEINIRQWHCYPEGATCIQFLITFCPFCSSSVKAVKEE